MHVLLHAQRRGVGDGALGEVALPPLAPQRAGGHLAIDLVRVGHLLLHLADQGHQRQTSLQRALQQRARHQQAVDLVGPLEDAIDARVAADALDGIVLDIAGAAEDLQRLVGRDVQHLGPEHLDDRRLDGMLLDAVDHLLLRGRIAGVDGAGPGVQ